MTRINKTRGERTFKLGETEYKVKLTAEWIKFADELLDTNAAMYISTGDVKKMKTAQAIELILRGAEFAGTNLTEDGLWDYVDEFGVGEIINIACIFVQEAFLGPEGAKKNRELLQKLAEANQ
ncbi:hypothetical protein [Zoogloea sp.]|uniref:hypothetical protein n=1 Tax=Zoogloea sp. TaxID=49181 RepID=UPI0014166379|nr:MAG: hypothetical protein F9K15_02410 [Zoogloea sp.]